jgi:hypothetical protein
MKTIDHAALLRKMRYEPHSGLFVWIDSASNVAKNGSIAGTVREDGYLQIKVLGVVVLAHRLAWFYVNGSWPEKNIDHANGNRADNRIANLRDLAQRGNVENVAGARCTSKTGLLGVSRYGARFRATIKINYRQKALGYFDTAEQAHAAYLAAKREHHVGGLL